MTVTCTQCGTGSPPGNRFCGRCGSPLPPSPGNLPGSMRRTASGTPAPWAATDARAAGTPCWQCGTAVDPIRQPSCPHCGAALTAPASPVIVPAAGTPSFQPPPPPPFVEPSSEPFAATPQAAPDQPSRRREAVISGPVLTIVVAIGIVLLLAVVGILAGQLIGR